MEEEKPSNNQEEVEDDVAVSMVEILEAEEKLQEDANAVLGGSDDRNCTYIMGYVDRQALYSCRTCATALSGENPAGVCLACSLECHEGHELIELYTKRNFRCDCGNSKFVGLTCRLCPNKLPTNSDNRYNHNYNGLYCSCSRPYPDPDDSSSEVHIEARQPLGAIGTLEEIEDEMIQCVICEDWFHKRHVTNCTVEDDFEEMICGSCMDSCHFLWAYARLCKAVYEKTKKTMKTDTEGDVDVLSDEKTSIPQETLSKSWIESWATLGKANDEASTSCLIMTEGANPGETSSKPSTASEECLPKGQSSEASAEASSSVIKSCRLKELNAGGCLQLNGAVFWPEDWRKQLCRCSKCMAMYEMRNVLFLLDENDTIGAYEARGKAKPAKTSYQQSLEALSKLHHVQQVDMIQEYNDLKSHLTEYLKKFAESKKVVRQEDVDEFFAQQTARKRQKTKSTSVPYFCK